MTPEQQRIKIAEVCGWKGVSAQFLVGYAPWRTEPYSARVNACPINELDRIPLDPLPDYLNDLNAMHIAEKRLHDLRHVWDRYCDFLGGSLYHCAHATAAQRARAFLETLGLYNNGTA